MSRGGRTGRHVTVSVTCLRAVSCVQMGGGVWGSPDVTDPEDRTPDTSWCWDEDTQHPSHQAPVLTKGTSAIIYNSRCIPWQCLAGSRGYTWACVLGMFSAEMPGEQMLAALCEAVPTQYVQTCSLCSWVLELSLSLL